MSLGEQENGTGDTLYRHEQGVLFFPGDVALGIEPDMCREGAIGGFWVVEEEVPQLPDGGREEVDSGADAGGR
jgi:hypothetical protein